VTSVDNFNWSGEINTGWEGESPDAFVTPPTSFKKKMTDFGEKHVSKPQTVCTLESLLSGRKFDRRMGSHFFKKVTRDHDIFPSKTETMRFTIQTKIT
jgi:hypothetical protein